MTKAEQARVTAWRFKVLQRASEGSRNVARTCRHFGLSRQAFYKWKKRFAEHGAAGLCDRPRTPRRSPRATPQDVVSKILYLRQTYHFGPGKIADYLKRFHSLSVARSSVHRILGKHGLNRLPANQKHRSHTKRWQRYEKPQPGHRLQMDVKFLERIPGTKKRLYQFTRLTIARAFACSRSMTRATSARRSDSSTRFCGVSRSASTSSRPTTARSFSRSFHWHLEALDIRHVYIRPRTPHLNGKVERSHRVDDQEFYQLLDTNGITDDIHLFNEKLREWEDYYNYHRPHGAWTARPRTNGSWQKRELECHRRPETPHSRCA